MVSSKPEVANHSENGVFPAHVNAWFILSDHEQFDRNFPSDKAVTLRYWMMKSERIQHCKVKSELLLWTALKRPLHTSCQERGRLHCRKLPQRGAREHSSRPPWKDGGKCNTAQRPFFPHSTEEDCSILSTITHIQQKDQHTKSLFTLHFLLKLLFLINALAFSCSHGKSCWEINSSIIDYTRCQAVNVVFLVQKSEVGWTNKLADVNPDRSICVSVAAPDTESSVDKRD